MTADLFADLPDTRPAEIPLAPGGVILPGFLGDRTAVVLREIEAISAVSPPLTLSTPGGLRMSVRTTSCGRAGWVSDSDGYRYSTHNPATQQPWPAMPPLLRELAREAATRSGYANFDPDSCLINYYAPGARMSLHQDRNERDCHRPDAAPIVSFSLGLPAVFLFGGLQRGDRAQKHRLQHGDVAVWGGPSRLNFHGIAPLADGDHPLLGRCRINLTFRTALGPSRLT